MVRYLAPYSPDFNPIDERYHQAKDFIRENDIAFRCVYFAFQETLAMSGDSTEEIIFNPFVTYISVSCAESYSA